MKKILLFLFFFLALSVQAQKLTGSWSGELNVGATKLNCVINLSTDSAGKDCCTFDSPDQGAKGIPTTIDFLSADSIHFTIPSVMASYGARLQGGLLRGTFVQGGFKLPLNLKQGKTPVAVRPQTPQPPFAYATEEVTFVNQEDHAVLCGTLTYPIGYERMNKKSVPVVLMVTGSGLQNRDEELFNHKPFLVIADFLARRGIASLRYDDRGIGQSKGDVATATTYNFMKDAAAGMEYLRHMGKFGKVGALGHSEGGTIMFMLAAQRKADFIVSLAGTSVRGDSILISQSRKALQLSGAPMQQYGPFLELLKERYQYLIDDKSSSEMKTLMEKQINLSGISLSPKMVEELTQGKEKMNIWLQYFMKYDPSNDIMATHCPVMALNGSADVQVIAAYNLPAIRKLLPLSKKNVIKEYVGLNHLFQHCATGNTNEYNRIEETISPEVLQDIADWIREL